MSNVRKALVGATGAGALLLGGVLAGPGIAQAADMVTGADIANGTIKQIDVGAAGVSGVRNGQDEIARRSIGQVDIGTSGVSGSAKTNVSEIAPGSIGAKDLSDDLLDGITGPAGPKGDPGQDGQDGTNGTDGADGADGVSGYAVHNTEVRWHSGDNETAMQCDDGTVALGGGYSMSGTANGDVADVHVNTDEPTYADGVATGWHVTGSAQGEVNVKSWVICAAVTPAPAQ
ncbi:MAG: hypothetical protein ACRDQA_03115 [Nocardioidaceae bacterium]